MTCKDDFAHLYEIDANSGKKRRNCMSTLIGDSAYIYHCEKYVYQGKKDLASNDTQDLAAERNDRATGVYKVRLNSQCMECSEFYV